MGREWIMETNSLHPVSRGEEEEDISRPPFPPLSLSALLTPRPQPQPQKEEEGKRSFLNHLSKAAQYHHRPYCGGGGNTVRKKTDFGSGLPSRADRQAGRRRRGGHKLTSGRTSGIFFLFRIKKGGRILLGYCRCHPVSLGLDWVGTGQFFSLADPPYLLLLGTCKRG